MKPLIKWAGGKRRLVDRLTQLFPEDYRAHAYHEPMVGGGALFFHIAPSKGTINDLNEDLINFYRVVRDEPGELLKWLEIPENKRSYFERARTIYNRSDALPAPLRAALFLYFNKVAYNGLWRVNSKGHFNVPFASYEDPTLADPEHIRSASDLLDGIQIQSGDFDYITDEAERHDLVYFDPPYHPDAEGAGFTQYTKEGFGMDDQIRLFEVCRELEEKDVYFILSNSSSKEIRDLYEGVDAFTAIEGKAMRRISCQGSGRGKVGELVVTNAPFARLENWA